MTRPLTCADRLPKQGDVIARGHYLVGLALHQTWWKVRRIAPYGRYLEWVLQEITTAEMPLIFAESRAGIERYRYVSRADNGRIDWPIDAGAYVE